MGDLDEKQCHLLKDRSITLSFRDLIEFRQESEKCDDALLVITSLGEPTPSDTALFHQAKPVQRAGECLPALAIQAGRKEDMAKPSD